jgi:putative oxidoreductase
MGIPPVLSVLSILAESAGSLFLLLGLFSRISAFGLAVTMIVAALTSHMQYGFFMNWSGTAPGEGFEFHILYIAIALAVLMKGAGAFAIDSILAERINGRKVESLKLQSIH